MTDSKNKGPRRTAPGQTDNLKSGSTSSSREESVAGQGEDAFARGSGVRKPESAGQDDGGGDNEVDASGKQSVSSSGTTPLVGERKDSDSVKGAGGVEGIDSGS